MPWFGSKGPAPAAKAANATKKNRSANLGIYKIFKGYTPKTKRSVVHRATNNDKRKNLIWNVSNSSPSEETFTKALARYQELDAKAENMSEKEVDEYTALRYFLSIKQKIHVNTGNAEDIMRQAIYPDKVDKVVKLNKANNNPTPLLPSVSRKGSIAGDPTINGTIQRMKCTVCESQSIIDKALKPGEAPRKCDTCGARAVVNDIGNVSNVHNYLNELPNPPIADYKSKTPANIPANAPNPPIAAYKSKTLANIPANAPNPPIAAYKSKTPANVPANAPNPPIAAYKSKTPANVPANAPNPPIAAYKSKTPANAAVPSTNPFNIPGPLPTPNTSNNPFNQFNNNNESKNVKGYYKILGLKSSASNDDIRKAYHNMLLKWHPNKNPNKKNEATEMTRKILEAHNILKNNEKRKQYNKSTRKNRRN